ncbi:phosphate ABC transporter substrate-binding protein PstS family protein [Lapidilactobacillus mulanensis]|uniref:Phosphate-binding protein n=1 Tax=Lapidilactobacillus mulanensis TaxID=2485999 RepID=A0ABW4DMV8_9LACO|nr:phosphate ABC transporter substrate-binding protein PstS family protein [Lapidilactobacillus mulanensis]
MKKRLIALLGLTSLLVILSGCQLKQTGESITAVGSSALQPLVEAAGDRFTEDNPGQFINVQGGGSGTGLSQIQAASVEIGNSDLYAEQKSGIDPKDLVDHKVAVVGVTPVVNPEISVKNLSTDQLAKIFSGDITNWNKLGGPNQKIVVINRAQGSGTRDTFERWVMKGRSTMQAQEQDSTGMVRQIVASTPGAISYMAFPYVDKTVKTVNVDNVTPTDKNVQINKWKIWSYEHMYTNGKPTGLTAKFMTYILSDTIQDEIVGEMGYIPIKDMKVSRTLAGKVATINE